MMKFLVRSLLVMGALFAAGCNVGGGKSAEPPADVKIAVGDGGATVSWTMQPGVEYWVFSAATSNLTPENWASQSQPRVVRNAVSPQIVAGLTNGTTYSITVNGRTSGGPGGPGSASLPFVPRLSGLVWTPGAAIPTANLKGLSYVLVVSPGVFVTVGAGGAAFTSNDAISWTAVTTGVTTDLNASAYGGGKHVAVGKGGVAVNSVDATTWATHSTGTTNDLNSVVLGGNGLVAVGANGTILRSADGGDNWAQQDGGTTSNLYSVIYAASQYIAVGANGTILRSTDGNSWVTAAVSGTPELRGIASNATGTQFVVIGPGGTMQSSPDLITWTAITPVTSTNLNAIAYGNQFTVVGDNGLILDSTDGTSWQAVASGTTANLNTVLFALVGYVAVGAGGVNLTSY